MRALSEEGLQALARIRAINHHVAVNLQHKSEYDLSRLVLEREECERVLEIEKKKANELE